MPKSLMTLFLLPLWLTAFPQDGILETLLENPGITWVAESESFLRFSWKMASVSEGVQVKEHHAHIGTYLISAEAVKTAPQYPGGKSYGDPSLFISEELAEGILQNRMEAFYPSGDPIPPDSLGEFTFALDSFVSFSPETYEPRIETIPSVPRYDWYVVRLLWYFDNETATMGSLLQSLSPILKTEGKGEVATDYKVFTIPMPQTFEQTVDYNNPDVAWCELVEMQQVDFSKMNTLKGDTKETLRRVFHDKVKEDKLMLSQGKWSLEEAGVLDKELYIKMLQKPIRDTAQIWRDQGKGRGYGFSNRVHTRHEGLDFGDIRWVTTKHYWVWNKRTRRLECRLRNVEIAVHLENEVDGDSNGFEGTPYTIWFE